MDALVQQVRSGGVHHALTVDPAAAGKTRRLNDDMEVGLAPFLPAGMPVVARRFVHDLKPRRIEAVLEALAEGVGDGHEQIFASER